MAWYSLTEAGLLLQLHIVPNARKTEIVGLHGDALKVKVHAPPVDGKANDEIIRFFSAISGVPKAQVQIASGELSKVKKILILGLQTLPQILGQYAHSN